jgi:hypothetical protein
MIFLKQQYTNVGRDDKRSITWDTILKTIKKITIIVLTPIKRGIIYRYLRGLLHLSQGSSTSTTQSYNQTSNWLKYRTRIVSVANKVNLDFKDAKPELQAQIAKQVSGIFG